MREFPLRMLRWARYSYHYVGERLHGLDFSMVYVGELQRTVDVFHGYSMTDARDMRRILQNIPVEAGQAAFLDLGCGKGMCLKCAVEAGFRKVAGLDIDGHLLQIARKNMDILKLDVDLFQANAVDFAGYADYDVFYFYNPFGRPIFEQVVRKILESQKERNREIWIAYYHPVFGDVFQKAGFSLHSSFPDKSRNTSTNIYHYPAAGERANAV